jgi:hypothetical protein
VHHARFSVSQDGTTASNRSPHLHSQPLHTPHQSHPTYSHCALRNQSPSRTKTECTALGFWSHRAEHPPQPKLPTYTTSTSPYVLSLRPPRSMSITNRNRVHCARLLVSQGRTPASAQSPPPHTQPPHISHRRYHMYAHHAPHDRSLSRTIPNLAHSVFGFRGHNPRP